MGVGVGVCVRVGVRVGVRINNYAAVMKPVYNRSCFDSKSTRRHKFVRKLVCSNSFNFFRTFKIFLKNEKKFFVQLDFLFRVEKKRRRSCFTIAMEKPKSICSEEDN